MSTNIEEVKKDLELEIGNTYTLIESSFEKECGLRIIKLTLQNAFDRTINGRIHKVFFFTVDDHPNIKVWTTRVEGGPTFLEQPIIFQPEDIRELTKEDKDYFLATFGRVYTQPIGYMICKDGNITECLSRYKEFLRNSIKAFKDKVKKMQLDCEKREILYQNQIKWLYNANNVELTEPL